MILPAMGSQRSMDFMDSPFGRARNIRSQGSRSAVGHESERRQASQVGMEEGGGFAGVPIARGLLDPDVRVHQQEPEQFAAGVPGPSDDGYVDFRLGHQASLAFFRQ